MVARRAFFEVAARPRYIASKEKTSSFFLNSDLIQYHLMIDKVVSIAEEWRFLEWEGLLPLLDDFDTIQALEMQSQPPSRA
jgi:hypothetical protein